MTEPDALARQRVDDEKARRAAQTDFDRPMVLQAGAGTGKTSTLIARLLHWCLGPGWDRSAERLTAAGENGAPRPEEVARRTMQGIHAITFTDAAAAEMNERAGTALAALARAQDSPAGFDASLLELPPDELRGRAEALLGSLDHLTVQTFHSWCRSLLVTRPLEAGIHPQFTVDADARLTEALCEEVVEAGLDSLYGAETGDSPGREAVELLAFGVGPEELRQALQFLVEAGVPAAELAGEAFTAERMRPPLSEMAVAAEELASLITPLLGLPRVKVPREVHELATALRDWAAERLASPLSATSLEAAVEGLRTRVDAKRIDTLKNWARGKHGSDWEQASLPALEPRLSACCRLLAVLVPGFLRLEPVRHELLRRVVADLMAEVEAEKRRRGILTFNDLVDHALHLLAKPSVAAWLCRKTEQLLVDEFQDTDPRQCDLVRRLALEGPREDRPGLFIVGDPKQSLYGWREADLAAYGRFLKDVLDAGGALHTLSVNFRSVPVILDEVGRVIGPVMREEEGVQPAFAPLLPSRERPGEGTSSDAGLPEVEYWTIWKQTEEGLEEPSAAHAAEREAEAAALDMRRRHDEEGEPWKGFAVLLRGRSHLPTILDALQAHGIPYLVSGERSYFRRREVVEAQALLRTILQPRDRLALATLLRAAWVGVPDAALQPLFAGGFDELLLRVTGPDAPELVEVARLARQVARSLPTDIPGLDALTGWEENLILAARALGELRRSFAGDSPDRFVANLRRLFLVDATEAARTAGTFRCANLDRFFRELETELEEKGDVAGILRFLNRSIESARESPAAPPAESNQDAVAVMTIHGAKGLDFDHVYLLQVGAQGARRGSPFSARRPLLPEEHWALTLGDTTNPERLLAAVEERRREAAERVRLLYVAMTRPKRRLVISGVWPPVPHPAADPLHAESFRELLELRTGLPGDFAELFHDGQGDRGIEAGGAWWRLLLAETEALTTPQRPAAPWIPSDAELSRSFAAQSQRREDALSRQARALVTRASDRGTLDDIEEMSSTGPAAVLAAPRETAAATEDDGHRGVARAVGTAIHRMFETWDPEADPEDEYRRQSDAVLLALTPVARERASELLSAFRDGPLYERWRDLLPHLEARELSILIPWPAERQDGVPDAALVGAIDLVYRDPETDEVVLGDFKTDRVGRGGPTLPEHVERYRSQADAYRRAVARVLGQAALPRFELWFLDTGEIVALPPAPVDPPAER